MLGKFSCLPNEYHTSLPKDMPEEYDNRNTDHMSACRLAAHWDEAYPHYMSQVSEYQREVVTNQTRAIRAAFGASTSNQRDTVLSAITAIENNIPNMRYPFEGPPE